MIRDLLPVDYGMPFNPANPDLGWYNHPVHLPRALDFCAAISAGNMKKLNGYDERFYKHVWYGDNDLILRVRRLGLEVVIPEYPFAVHQWHDHNHVTEAQLADSGIDLYNHIEQNEAGNYKAVHNYTPDL